MDFQPHEAALAERLLLAKGEQAPAEIVTNGAEMGRDGVCPAPEVHVVRDVKGVVEVLQGQGILHVSCGHLHDTPRAHPASQLQSIVELATLCMVFPLLVSHELEFGNVPGTREWILRVGVGLHGLGVRSHALQARDIGDARAAVPHLEHDVKDRLVDAPCGAGQDVQAGKDVVELVGVRGGAEVGELLGALLEAHCRDCRGEG